MNETLKRGFAVLSERTQWQSEQQRFTAMRTDGLRRLNKPFPTAADLHFPLVDMTIGDLKPFWMAQMFGGDRISDFLPMKSDLAATAEQAADYFDFKLRYGSQQPNLRYGAEQMVDVMLQRGRGVLMATTNPYDDWNIGIKSIDPQFILMGQQFDDFWDADSWIWVQKLSIGQYRMDQNFNQTKEDVAKIRGRTGFQINDIYEQKELIEGVTHTDKTDEILLWHQYERRPSGALVVTTVAPMSEDVEIRAPFEIPYELEGKTSCPFYSFTMEILGSGGWYAPRSVSRLLAAFEAYMTKCWNEDSDNNTFLNRPLFTGDEKMDNANNWDFFPGSYVPGNVQAVQMGTPPISLMERINFGRGLAERRARVPDFGQFSPDDTSSGKPITATQSKIAAGLQAVGADHNGDTFRNVRLLAFYKHLWCLMLHRNKCQMAAAASDQTKTPSLSYIMANELQELPPQAMAEAYLVLPAGGSANKETRQQKAMARFGLLGGKPNIDQDELTRQLIAADDARLVKKLLIPQNQKQASEAYNQDVELLVLAEGRPVPVLAGQDHVTHIMECAQYLHAQEVKGVPPNPMAIQQIQQHMAQHLQYLKQTQPAAVKQVMMMVQQIEQAPAPGKVVGMPQAGGQAPQIGNMAPQMQGATQ